MRIEKFVEKPLSVDINDTVSKVSAKMHSQQKREAIVTENGKYVGMLYARSIIKRNIPNPNHTKILGYVKKINPLLPDTPIEEVLDYMLLNNLRAVPIKKYKDDKASVFLITRLGILKAVSKEALFKGKTAADVMVFPYCIGPDDDHNRAKAIFRDLNISNLPVVDGCQAVGMIGELTMLGMQKPVQRQDTGESGGKKQQEEILVKSFMRKDFYKIYPDSPLSEVINIMTKKAQPTVIVEKDDKVVGIITRKDVLKVLGQKVKGVYVRISGLQREDSKTSSLVNEKIESFVQKIAKFESIDDFVVDINRYRQTGERMKFSVKTRISAGKVMHVAEDSSWDLLKSVQKALAKLEREMKKHHNKSKSYQKSL